MDPITEFLFPFTAYHWLALGLLLIGLELLSGTIDLLLIGIASMITAGFALITPDPIGLWQGQIVCFAILSVVFVTLGRTVFKSWREKEEDHPVLNNRMARMIGKTGRVSDHFIAGEGRVQIDDTVWAAKAMDADHGLAKGDSIKVEDTLGTIVLVRRI